MWTMQDTIHVIPVLCGIITFVLCVRKLMIGGMSPNQKLIEQAKENGCMTKATLLDTWFKAGQRDGKSAEARYPSKYAIYEYYVDGKRYTIVFHAKIRPGSHFTYPEVRTLYYKKGHPKKAISEGQAGKEAKMERGCLLSILYTILVMIVVARLLVWFGVKG